VKQKGSSDFEAVKESVRGTFDRWIVKSIDITFQATSESERNNQGGTPLAAYLLLSCAIDAIAGFYAGRTSKEGTGEQYKEFIKRYMSRYSPENMYGKLRCALAHNFSTGEGLALTHGRSYAHNVRSLTGDVIVKNFEDVFNDFKIGLEQYFHDLDGSDDLKRNFMKRFRKFGLASAITINYRLSANARIDTSFVSASGGGFDPSKPGT